METNVKESKFGDIILWDKIKKKFVSVRNYYKLPNLLKTNDYEVCCMSLGNGLFVCLKELKRCNWYEAIELAKYYNGSAPIKSYLPSIDELESFYPLIKEFNGKVNKLKSLRIACNEIKALFYWSSTEYSSNRARFLGTFTGACVFDYKNYKTYVRAFIAF